MNVSRVSIDIRFLDRPRLIRFQSILSALVDKTSLFLQLLVELLVAHTSTSKVRRVFRI